jgi:hypothetical protein
MSVFGTSSLRPRHKPLMWRMLRKDGGGTVDEMVEWWFGQFLESMGRVAVASAPPEPAPVAPLIPQLAALAADPQNRRPRAFGRLRKRPQIPLLDSVGARGFEPPTFCSQMRRRAAGGARWA